MKGTQYTINHVTPYVKEFVFNLETIYNNGNILHDYDIKEIPLYDDQEDYSRDPEIIDSFLADSNQPQKSRHYNSAKMASTRLKANSLKYRVSRSFHNCKQQSWDATSEPLLSSKETKTWYQFLKFN